MIAVKKVHENDQSLKKPSYESDETDQGEQIDMSDESLNSVKKIFENGSASQLQTSSNNFVSSELRSETVLIPKKVMCSLKEMIDDICAISAKQKDSFIKVPIVKLKMLEHSMQKFYPNNSKESTQTEKFNSLDTRRIKEVDGAQQNMRELTANGIDINGKG